MKIKHIVFIGSSFLALTLPFKALANDATEGQELYQHAEALIVDESQDRGNPTKYDNLAYTEYVKACTQFKNEDACKALSYRTPITKFIEAKRAAEIVKVIEEAIPSLSESCRGGRDVACPGLGYALIETGKQQEGVTEFKRLCDHGDYWSCGAAAHQLGEKNPDGLALLQKACTGDARLCRNPLRTASLKDPTFFVNKIAKACDKEGAQGSLCAFYSLYLERNGNHALAVSTTQASCSRGNFNSCNIKASRELRENSRSMAIETLKSFCDSRQPASSTGGGVSYFVKEACPNLRATQDLSEQEWKWVQHATTKDAYLDY
jgi:hypothetical protein